eukprot:jgi/Botrbrau1/15413/Bobra.43_2s0039.1
MHFMRRKEGEAAARKVFLRARKWPKAGWQVYVASAQMEFRFLPTKEDTKVPRNIFELGLANYLTEPSYVLNYVEFLLSLGDLDNLRALLERALAVTPAPAITLLFDRYIQIEYANGDLTAVSALERRRREAVPPTTADDMHLLLLKYRELDLWPCTPVQRVHLERLMGVTGADQGLVPPTTRPQPVPREGANSTSLATSHRPPPRPSSLPHVHGGPSPAYGLSDLQRVSAPAASDYGIIGIPASPPGAIGDSGREVLCRQGVALRA